MSNLLSKSEQNSICADWLIDKKHFNAAVNRAYYSSLQCVLFILKTQFNVPDNLLTPDGNNSTHVKAMSLINPELEKRDYQAFLFFQQAFLGLKQQRVKADYKDFQFDKISSNKIVTTSVRINETLKKTLITR